MQMAGMVIWAIMPMIVTIVSLSTYVLTSGVSSLAADKAFVSLALFMMLRPPLNLLPMFFNTAVQVF